MRSSWAGRCAGGGAGRDQCGRPTGARLGREPSSSTDGGDSTRPPLPRQARQDRRPRIPMTAHTHEPTDADEEPADTGRPIPGARYRGTRYRAPDTGRPGHRRRRDRRRNPDPTMTPRARPRRRSPAPSGCPIPPTHAPARSIWRHPPTRLQSTRGAADDPTPAIRASWLAP